MNEKQKEYMKKQSNRLVSDLEKEFGLTVYVDEKSDDEITNATDHFLIVHGDMRAVESKNQLYQDVFVVYVSRYNPSVEETTLDVITIGSRVNGFNFKRTMKERVQLGETNDFLDQVTIMFRRKLSYECAV